MKTLQTLLISGLATSALTVPALSQSPDANPAFGTVELQAGFPDDPSSHPIRAGGAINASMVSDSCYGFITDEPTLVLNYDAGSLPLYISGATDADTVLVVHTPGGEWSCNDDSPDGGLNPGIEFDQPDSGRYAIWLGTYSAGVGYPAGMIHISELGFDYTNPFSRGFEPDAPAARSVSLQAGFEPDPYTVTSSAGGPVEGSAQSDVCFGYYSEAPSLRLNYTAADYSLYLSGEGDFDGTMAVLTPSGQWLCDDDSAGSLNPGVIVNDPESGIYNIWFGRLGSGPEQEGSIHVSEIGFAGQDHQLDLGAAPVHGASELESGFLPDPLNVDVMAGGDLSLDQATMGQTVSDGFCTGYVTRAATYELTYEAGDLPLYISASADEDLTLAVNAPDGSWWCSDDAFDGLNPGLVMSDPQSGVYDIYVGRYSEASPVPAQLHISETGFGSDGLTQPFEDEFRGFDEGEPFDLDLFADPVSGTLDLGSLLDEDPMAIPVVAGGEFYAGNANNTGDAFCTGYVTEAATLELNYDGDGPIYFTATGDQDLTMIINTPNGGWVCDDDSGDGLNPAMAFEDDASGIYDIWIGTYGGGTADAELVISTQTNPVEF